MIKNKNINMHLILGIVVGIIIAGFIIVEGSWVYFALLNNGTAVDTATFNRTVSVLVVLAFIASILIFNNKRFRKVNLNKISIYLLLSIILSIIGSMIFMGILSKQVSWLYLKEPISIIEINIFAGFLLIGSIAVFIVIFLLLVNKKVKYIKFLSKEVKNIRDEGFGKTITVKGKDELAELCENINSMSVELKKRIDSEKVIEKNKNELITNVSHDLRTPLTAIIGYIDLMKNSDFKDEEKLRQYVGIIDERVKSLNKLINELFEYTKLNSHDIKLNISEVDIGALVEQIVGEYTYIFEKENLRIEKDIIDKDIIINIDIEKIVRVIENLLSNALKYSIKGTEVIIKLKEKEDGVELSVCNKTNEISKGDLENLFERFYKVDKSRKEAESTGLGLSIVKRILELHNGDIKVKVKDDFITFKIYIPYEIN